MTQRVVVVFAGRYASESSVESVEAMSRRYPAWRFLVVQEFPLRSRRRVMLNRLKRLRSEPLRYVAAIMRAPRESRRNASRAGTGLSGGLDRIKSSNVAYLAVERLHAESTLTEVRNHKPWLGVAIQAPILKPQLFTIPELGTINLHKSLLPEYRGMPPGFWELHDGAERSGATVHWIDSGLDTGQIVAQEEIGIPPYTTPMGLRAQLDMVGVRVLLHALDLVDRGVAVAQPQGDASTPTRSRPTASAEAAVRHLCQSRRSAHAPKAAFGFRVLKAAVLGAYVYLWCPVRNAYRAVRGTSRTAVLLYHRVNDDYLDSLTVGVEQFAQQLRLLRRWYDVIDPLSFLATEAEPCRKTRVVITFDDGYRDNYLASMLMRREGVCGVFFVSTRIVGTDLGFPHDLRRTGRPLPVLSWDEAQEMAGAGFFFGNHTADHADLGALSSEEALGQVQTAREDLEARFPSRPGARWLAFPFGLRHNMTDDVRQALPSAGIDCCFSAYGGTNAPGFDRWNILRQSVDHTMSPLRLRAAIEGWAVKS